LSQKYEHNFLSNLKVELRTLNLKVELRTERTPTYLFNTTTVFVAVLSSA